MAEPEIATKAPESDAQSTPELSVSSESPVPAQPQLSDHCTSDRPTPAGQASTGEITKLNDIDVSLPPPPSPLNTYN